jgi:hypothetical protein
MIIFFSIKMLSSQYTNISTFFPNIIIISIENNRKIRPLDSASKVQLTHFTLFAALLAAHFFHSTLCVLPHCVYI